MTKSKSEKSNEILDTLEGFEIRKEKNFLYKKGRDVSRYMWVVRRPNKRGKVSIFKCGVWVAVLKLNFKVCKTKREAIEMAKKELK